MGQATPLRSRRRKAKPVFYLLAGPNGAGKSTLYKALVQAGTIPVSAEFVNADLFERDHLRCMWTLQRDSQMRCNASNESIDIVSTFV